jgi:hypothetical protein
LLGSHSRTPHRRLRHIDYTGITWIIIRKLLSKLRTIHMTHQSTTRPRRRVRSDFPKHIIDTPQKRSTASLHKPNLKLAILRDQVEQRLTAPTEIVCSKNRLVKFLIINIGHGKIKTPYISSSLRIDQHNPSSRHDQNTFSFKSPHLRNFHFPFNLISLEDEEFSFDSTRFEIARDGRVESHILIK